MAYESKPLKDMTTAEKEELLEEIRSRYTYAVAEWAHIREDARKDMLCIAGEVWEALDPIGLKNRQAAKRPALSLDEVGQYIDQTVNGVRANPRAIKFSPTGEGTNDKVAGFYADKTREIEYRSKASNVVYPTAFEAAVSRGYGFCKVSTRYRRGARASNEQEIWLEPKPNPDLVLPDPNALMPDSSDMRYCFELEGRTTRAEFQQEYPDASVTDFDSFAKSYPDWFKDETVTLAAYWRVTGKVEDDDVKVCQYITNGVEILKKNEWAGRYIPIISCYGKVLYVPQSGTTKRHLVSMTRLARDPLMLYCYYRTQQAEMAGMIPKAPVVAAEGQMDGYEAEWQKAAHEPVAYLLYKAMTEATGQNMLPPPSRLDYHAGEHLQALELCAEGARRAIQAAMQGSPLPTQAQRRNEKSGVALKRMEESGQRGSFHYVDHYNLMIEQVGIIIEDLMPHVYDSPRAVGVRKADETADIVMIADPNNPNQYAQGQQGQQGQQGPEPIDPRGDYLVTISTGPSSDSLREESNEFLESFLGNPELLGVAGPEKAPKLLAQVVKSRNLGPSGDKIAEIIDPALAQDGGEPNPQQLQAALAEKDAQLKQLTQIAEQMKQEIDTDAAKQQATLQKAQIDAQTTLQVAEMAEQTKLKIAEMANVSKPVGEHAAKAEEGDEQRAFDLQLEEIKHQHAMELERLRGELAEQAAMRALDTAIVTGNKEHAQGKDSANLAHAHDVDSQERGHRQALEQGDQKVSGAIAVQESKPKPGADAAKA